MHSATDYSFDDLEEGACVTHEYVITPAVYDALVSVFGDRSPIHVDSDYASAAGFDGCVMHGAIFQGFVSHFVGMWFPGRRSLLLSSSLNYHLPSYLNDELELRATVKQKNLTARVVVLNIEFFSKASKARVVSGRVHVAIRNG